MQETQVWSLGQEDPLEKGMATHSSILAWESHGQRSLGRPSWDKSGWADKAKVNSINRRLQRPASNNGSNSQAEDQQETEDLNITLHQLDLTGTLGTFHPTTVEYTFLPSIHGTLLKMCHMLDHKPNFDKFKIIEFIQSIFFAEQVDFPGGPMAKTQCSQCRGPGFNPGSGN